MNSFKDKIEWFCEKLFENIKMIFLCLSVLVIGIGLIGIEELSKRTNLPQEILTFVLVGLFAQVILSIIDTLDQEKKTEPKKKSDFVYRNKEGHLVHYYPDGYNVVSKSETQFENSCENTYTIKAKSDNPIQEFLEKDKENLDQILDEDTSEETLTLANTVSRINTHPTKDDLDNIEHDAPVLATLTEDSALEASDQEQSHQEVKQAHTKTTIGDPLDIIKHHSDSMVVKQEGQQLTIKATLNQEKKTQENQWGEF